LWIILTACSFRVQKPLIVYAFMQVSFVWISTVSTWFSTEKALISLVKLRLCGKLTVEFFMHNEFSTYGTIVENSGLFVENSRKNRHLFLTFCHPFVTKVTVFLIRLN